MLCHGLKSIDEHPDWDPFPCGELVQKFTYRYRDRPHLLACHDFKGGYTHFDIHNCIVDGLGYSVQYWELIDIFVYFSHSRVTIPPANWISVCHTNNTPVLGTLLFEWEASRLDLNKLLADPEFYASKFAFLCHTYGFDGWLVNIETSIEVFQVDVLLQFIRYLKFYCKDHLVLWYDSVSALSGEINYQSILNQHNSPFFDECDGIFTDYHWEEKSPSQSADFAGPRSYDVFTGIDVFGRGTFGGGGFQSSHALQVSFTSGTSAALFAPGWTFEESKNYNDYLIRDELFWSSIRGVFDKLSLNVSCFISTPFTTSFNPGSGKYYWNNGVVVYSDPWTYLSVQEQTSPALRQIRCYDHVFNGSCSVSIPRSFLGPIFQFHESPDGSLVDIEMTYHSLGICFVLYNTYSLPILMHPNMHVKPWFRFCFSIKRSDLKFIQLKFTSEKLLLGHFKVIPINAELKTDI